MDDKLRVTGKKIDELQAVIAHLKDTGRNTLSSSSTSPDRQDGGFGQGRSPAGGRRI